MADHTFCRVLLREVMKVVRKHVAAKDIKEAWGYRLSCFNDDTVEFHGPNGFYWYGQGCCVWVAKATGWGAYLKSIGVNE